MSRKDFQLIADTLKSVRPDPEYQFHYAMWQETCHAFAHSLRQTNPLFDRTRFLTACGLGATNATT